MGLFVWRFACVGWSWRWECVRVSTTETAGDEFVRVIKVGVAMVKKNIFAESAFQFNLFWSQAIQSFSRSTRMTLLLF